jgi:ubiquinone/menaquinone biosynthesis C-methylase UbiE
MKSQKEYWDEFVLAWDISVYQADASNMSLLEKLATLWRGKLRLRHQFTVDFLRPVIQQRKVLELGCGTGRLSCDLLQIGAAKVTGIDISESAIALAAKRAAGLGILSDRYTFFSAEIETIDFSNQEFDIVVGLGILQYLRPEALENIFSRIRRKPLFFEFHEQSVSWLNFLHWTYRTGKVLLYKNYPFYRTISRTKLRALLGQPAYYCQVSGVSFFTTFPQAASNWESL